MCRNIRNAQLAHTALAAGLNVLVTGADSVWEGNALQSARARLQPNQDMAGVLDATALWSSVFFVRSSESTIRAWAELEESFTTAAEGENPATVASLWLARLHERKSVKVVSDLTLHRTPFRNGTDRTFLPLSAPLHEPLWQSRRKLLHKWKLWNVKRHENACDRAHCKRRQ